MYYSQHGQDKYLNEVIFKNMKNGVFLDIGAHDGISINNSYFFEKELTWTGICVEANPNVFKKLEKNRKCTCVNTAISNVSDVLEYTIIEGYSEMLSGLTKNYDKRMLKRINNDTDEFKNNVIKKVNIKTQLLTDVCEENKMTNFDFCSIDVEGSEMDVLRSIDFSKINIKCFVIENNYRIRDYKVFLKQYGYKKIHYQGCDDYYIKKDNVSHNNSKIVSDFFNKIMFRR